MIELPCGKCDRFVCTNASILNLLSKHAGENMISRYNKLHIVAFLQLWSHYSSYKMSWKCNYCHDTGSIKLICNSYLTDKRTQALVCEKNTLYNTLFQRQVPVEKKSTQQGFFQCKEGMYLTFHRTFWFIIKFRRTLLPIFIYILEQSNKCTSKGCTNECEESRDDNSFRNQILASTVHCNSIRIVTVNYVFKHLVIWSI